MVGDSASSKKPKSAKPKSEKNAIFRLLAFFVLPFMDLAARYKVIDADKLPKQGSFVLAPNHYSEIDPLVVAVVVYKLGRVPRFLAKASLFKIPVVSWLLRKSGQIPVERAGSTRGSEPLKAASTLVESL